MSGPPNYVTPTQPQLNLAFAVLTRVRNIPASDCRHSHECKKGAHFMAGWDAFLTEQDKAHLAYLGTREKKGFGENPCMLVVDDYYSVLGLEREPILESIKTW